MCKILLFPRKLRATPRYLTPVFGNPPACSQLWKESRLIARWKRFRGVFQRCVETTLDWFIFGWIPQDFQDYQIMHGIAINLKKKRVSSMYWPPHTTIWLVFHLLELKQQTNDTTMVNCKWSTINSKLVVWVEMSSISLLGTYKK